MLWILSKSERTRRLVKESLAGEAKIVPVNKKLANRAEMIGLVFMNSPFKKDQNKRDRMNTILLKVNGIT